MGVALEVEEEEKEELVLGGCGLGGGGGCDGGGGEGGGGIGGGGNCEGPSGGGGGGNAGMVPYACIWPAAWDQRLGSKLRSALCFCSDQPEVLVLKEPGTTFTTIKGSESRAIFCLAKYQGFPEQDSASSLFLYICSWPL